MKATALLLIAICVSSFCQTPSTQSVPAKQIVEKAIAALATSGPANAEDFRLTGSMRIGDSSDEDRVKVVSRGLRDMRLEIAMHGGGTHSVTFLRGLGRMRDRTGKETRLSSSSQAGTEIAFLPMPGILADLLGSARELTLAGEETVNGRPAHHVIISRRYSQAQDPLGVLTARSRTEIFIDSENSLILKVSNLAYDARGHKSSQRELTFSDYRSVNGLVLPFSIIETSDGQKSWTITVESIELSPKLVDTDFKL